MGMLVGFLVVLALLGVGRVLVERRRLRADHRNHVSEAWRAEHQQTRDKS